MDLKGIKLTWLGHATFRIETPEGKTLYVDPWIGGNPACPESEKNVKNADMLVITHGHFDHIADAVELGKREGRLWSGFLSCVRGWRKRERRRSAR